MLQAYSISTKQTPAIKTDDGQTRVNFYLNQLKENRNALPLKVRHLASDGYYAKKKYIDGVIALGLQPIGKLRYDANLRWLYKGEQKPRGRRRLYDGKVKIEELGFEKARFQIEFLFRDAKQFLGLNDCQARCSASLNFHFNASMSALNLLKLEDRDCRLNKNGKTNHVISIASWKIRKFNEHLLERLVVPKCIGYKK